MACCCSRSPCLTAISRAASGEWRLAAIDVAGTWGPVGSLDDARGLPWLRLQRLALGLVGCAPPSATMALPSWLASASVTRICLTAPVGMAAAAHSASHWLASNCDMKQIKLILMANLGLARLAILTSFCP